MLLHQFESSLADGSADAQAFRWAIANTLDSISGKSDVETLVRLLRDPRSARARGLLSVAAAKTKDRRVVPILLDYLDSEDLQGFAARGLGLMRAREAVQKLKIVAAKTSNSWVRRETLKALKKLASEDKIVN
jgi:HEAT repeat protein